MKTIICAVYDKATAAYMRPFTMQSVGQAMRQFSDELENEQSPIAQHPEDYSLFQLATFTDHDGNIEPNEPKCLARAHEIKAQKETK